MSSARAQVPGAQPRGMSGRTVKRTLSGRGEAGAIGGRAFRHPADNVAGARHDDDQVERGVIREYPCEDQFEGQAIDARAADVANVGVVHTKGTQGLRRPQPGLDDRRPLRILIQSVTLDDAATGHQHSEGAPFPGHGAPPLAKLVDQPPHHRLHLGMGWPMEVHPLLEAGTEDEISASPNPAAGENFRDQRRAQQRQEWKPDSGEDLLRQLWHQMTLPHLGGI